jgi:hypothetical protein
MVVEKIRLGRGAKSSGVSSCAGTPGSSVSWCEVGCGNRGVVGATSRWSICVV